MSVLPPIAGIIQEAPMELPVPMTAEGESAYKKHMYMQESWSKLKELKRLKKEMKEMIDERRNENHDWLHLQQDKKNLQSDLAEISKKEKLILQDLNQQMGDDLDKLDGLISREKDRQSFFDAAALECAKDPIQMRLVMFNEEGICSESISAFSAKVVKQKRPQKNNRESVYTRSQFIRDTFEKKQK